MMACHQIDGGRGGCVSLAGRGGGVRGRRNLSRTPGGKQALLIELDKEAISSTWGGGVIKGHYTYFGVRLEKSIISPKKRGEDPHLTQRLWGGMILRRGKVHSVISSEEERGGM